MLILLGLVVGFGSTLLGMGGSIFIIPILPIIVEISLKETIATGIFTVFFVTAMNTYRFHRNGLVDWRLGFILLPTSSTFSFLSAYYSSNVSEVAVKYLLLFIVGLMITRLLFLGNKTIQLSRKKSLTIALISGSVAGIFSGLTGIGAGVLLGPTLLILNLTDHKKVSPTINFLIAVSCFFASLGYLNFSEVAFPKWGMVSIHYALGIFLASLIGAIFGRRLNSTISPLLRKRLVAVVLIVFSLKLIL